MDKEAAKLVKVGDRVVFKGMQVTVNKITHTKFGNPNFWFNYKDRGMVVGWQDVRASIRSEG